MPVGGLACLGYGWAYRVLDAQYFGLAQRRKRVFVVGYLGDWRRAAAVLFEPASLRGDTAPGRETREGIANALTELADRGGTNSEGQRLIAGTLSGVARSLNAHPSRIDGESETFVVPPLMARSSRGGTQGLSTGRSTDGHIVAHSLRADGFDASEDGTGRGTPLVAQAFDILGTPATRGGAETDVHTALRSRAPGQSEASTTTVIATSAVRRLTPTECERLQGFPDGWTDVAFRGKPAADGPRYRALGNAFAVPVVRWIARRIVQEVGYDG